MEYFDTCYDVLTFGLEIFLYIFAILSFFIVVCGMICYVAICVRFLVLLLNGHFKKHPEHWKKITSPFDLLFPFEKE